MTDYVNGWFNSILMNSEYGFDCYMKTGDFNKNIKNDKGITGLMLACGRERIDMVKELLQDGVDVNLVSDNLGNSALIYASSSTADWTTHNIIRYLLKFGADISIRNKNGKNCIDVNPVQFKDLDIQNIICETQPHNIPLLKDIAIPEIKEKYKMYFNMGYAGLL